MNHITPLFTQYEGLAGVILKVTLLLLLALGLIHSFTRLEPRWKVCISRLALILLPVLATMHFFTPVWQVTVPETIKPASPNQNTPISIAAEPSNQSTVAKPAPTISPLPLLLSLWLMGAAFFIGREIYQLYQIRRLVRQSAAPSIELREIWNATCVDFDIPVYKLQTVPESISPFVCPGLQGPVIVPELFASKDHKHREKITHALRHEAAHLQSHDGLWIPLMQLSSCLLWWHPLVWALSAAHLKACEESSDAAAARLGGIGGYRRALAQLALDLAPAPQAPVVSFLRTPSVVKRLKAVLANGELAPPKWWKLLPVLLAFIFVGSGLGVFQLIAEEKAAEPENAAPEKSGFAIFQEPIGNGVKMINRHRQVYRVVFSENIDNKKFTLKRAASNKWREAFEYSLSVGDSSPDQQIRIDSFVEKKAKNKQGEIVDASVLTITFLPKGTKHELVRNVQEDLNIYYAELNVTIEKKRNIFVREGDSFNLIEDPNHKARITDVKPGSLILHYEPSPGEEKWVELVKQK